MSNIYLNHPVHGNKIATLEQEAIADESKGWKRYNLDTQTDEVAETPEVIAAPVNTLEVKRRRKSIE
jgi:hypothetical protein